MDISSVTAQAASDLLKALAILSDTTLRRLQLIKKTFTFIENAISNSPKVPRATFLGSDGLFCFNSIHKFGSFKNPFATINSLPELYFRFRRFSLLVQTKKVISMN